MNRILKRFKELQMQYQPETQDFCYSLGYIQQATRNGLYVDEDETNSVIYTKRHQKSDQLVIIASAGQDRDKYIAESAVRLVNASQKPIIIKNVDTMTTLYQYGCRDYTPTEKWDNLSRYDDNTFPQQVVSVNDACSLRGKNYRKLRWEMKRFDEGALLEVHPYTSPALFDFLMDKWVRDICIRTGCDEEEARRSNMMYRIPDPDIYHQFQIKDYRHHWLGIINFSHISMTTLAYNMMIVNPEYRNIYRRCIYEGIKIAQKLGYEYLNLQGSETLGQHLSKRRFKANIEIPKKHMVYDRGRGERPHEESNPGYDVRSVAFCPLNYGAV